MEIYGVEQTNHGHLYRWVFNKETLEQEGIDLDEASVSPYGVVEDIGFPIGGSNSSGTWIIKLKSEEEIKNFLLRDWDTDYEDPTLIDIAEGVQTICTEDGSITSEYVRKFNIPDEMLTRENGLLKGAEEMIKKLKNMDIDCDIDFENPFYGASRDMRFSELNSIFKESENREPEI